ncbi:MAG: ABC transporter permease [Reichenbachiella sp.]|uniref:ABC transporter permease n=1 Tax=Reichenbachiella sp. TaxID=2184521 RepID=UPI0029662118|nr:ABC transporter permease [Reichenbachiella sp.]MDW3211413.1 ABC transporter permease [Reichenbachiella sp.]
MKKDHKPPKWADRFFSWYCQNELAESILGDLHEWFEDQVDQKGLFRARLLYWVNVLKFINKFTLKRKNPYTTLNSTPMIKNYLLVAIRGLSKNKVFASINMIGLALGLASCFLIFSFVKKELTFDLFHSKADNIYRVTNRFERPNRTNLWARTPPALAPAIRANFSGVERTTRLRYTDDVLYTVNDRSFYQGNGFYADSLFLEMFDFPLIVGDRSTALDEPGNIVLTASIAKKFFGDQDPMGQLITLENETTLKVTGILKPIPTDSHITFDLLISFPTYVVPDGYLADLNSWGWAGFWTYVELSNQTNLTTLQAQIAELYKANYQNSTDVEIEVFLQPLKDLYLGSSNYSNIGESIRVGNRSTILGLSVVVFLILLVASCNFMNLSTAMSLRRGKEIGIRKVLGAVRSRVSKQFLIESVMISLFSLGLALVILLLFGPYFNQLFTLELEFSNVEILQSLPIFVLGTIIIGLIAGIYPSFVLAAFSPILALKGYQISFNSGAWLRKSLIVFQFVIALSLIIFTVIVASQIEYIQTKSLGFDRENLVKLRIGTEEGHYETLRNRLLANSRVTGLTKHSHAFDGSASSGPAWLKGQSSNDAHQLSYYQTEHDFLQVTGVKLLEGRFFSKDFATDEETGLVLNQSAVTELGLADPIGQKVNFHNRERIVVGVVEDFHFGSLHTPIGPMGIVMPFVNLEQVLIKVQGSNLRQTMLSLESDWHAVAGDLPFEASFVEDGIRAMYEKEEKIATLISSASTLAVILACLGLYALVAFSIQNRLKEIGIRKALGAPLNQLVMLLAKKYILLILIANVIAWPITYFLAAEWLGNFAYRISIAPALFVGSGIALFLIAMVTIAYQLVKASLVSPVKYLRSE